MRIGQCMCSQLGPSPDCDFHQIAGLKAEIERLVKRNNRLDETNFKCAAKIAETHNENEKLRSMLAEAREYIPYGPTFDEKANNLFVRIDDALGVKNGLGDTDERNRDSG
jgi:hypothetical protein